MEIIVAIAAKIAEDSVAPIARKFDYISSTAILEEVFMKLLEKNEAMEQYVFEAQWNEIEVSTSVKTWLANVREQIEEVQKFLEEDFKTNGMCWNGWCLDLKLRYRLDKKAHKSTQAIVKLLKECEVENIAGWVKGFDRVENIVRWGEDFESRKSMIENVLVALKDDKIDMIALCGMGGIGKSLMARQIARRVEDDGLFNKVAIEMVSQNNDLLRVQGHLERSVKMCSSLMNSKSVLVILDDVWEPLDLKVVGIYDAIKEKSCKVLLTSRNEETARAMGIQHIFPVKLLAREEAWYLFRKRVGDCINTPNLISIAKQIVKECGRLPYAITKVGDALHNKRECEWKFMLQQLRMPIRRNIYGMPPIEYSSTELIYNGLESDEAKSCFLLCCLYPDDDDIPVEHLVRYVVAKGFNQGSCIVEKTRKYVNSIVRNLQTSKLLLDSERDECVRMDDVVRDFAISIASRDEHGFMVELDKRLEKWPQEDTYDDYTTISLLLGKIKGHLDVLKCPKLKLLRLSCLNNSETLLGNLFNEMNELEMLSLQEACFFSKLPPSIQILENLHMLNLESCRLRNVSAIGRLKNLEILSFRDSEIEELPCEIGNLHQLKLLDMKRCSSLKRIAKGVISNLSQLQELYIAKFKNWECTSTIEGKGEGTSNNANLEELFHYLGQMTVLEISIPSIRYLPNFNNSNLRFRINIEDDGRYLFENAIRLQGTEDASDPRKIMEMAISKGVFGNVVHYDILNCEGLENIFWLAMWRDLVKLKSLAVDCCESIEEIFSKHGNSKEKVISDVIELLRLKKIQLIKLPRLIGICKSIDSVEVGEGLTTPSHKLFSSNTILWFPNLEELLVKSCESLEVVFDLEGLKVTENQAIPALSHLTSLKLWYLSRMTHVWKNIPQGFQGFQNLLSIDIRGSQSLGSLLPTSVAKLLVQLQTIEIRNCKLMENIIQREFEVEEEMRADIIIFPKIHSFKLYDLENLVSFSSETHSFKWPSVKQIDLKYCPKLKTLGSEVQSGRKLIKKDVVLDARATQEPSAGSSSASVTLTKQEERNASETENQIKMWSLFPYNLIESLENLVELSARDCHSLEVIFELEGLNVEESNYIFNNLTKLRLGFLPKLLHIWQKVGPRDIKGFNNLRLLQVRGCDSLKCLFTPSIAKLLGKLEEILVWNCIEMEEILAKESRDEAERDYQVITFNQVKTLSLKNLPKLKCFSNEANAFYWWSLEKIEMAGCKNLKKFVSASISTPKLKGVHTESGFQPMKEGGLNTTIQQIIKREGTSHSKLLANL